MLVPGLLLSIALPALAGLPWMLAAQNRRAPGVWPLAIAYGYALGLLITTAGMRVLDLAHLPINLLTAATLPAIAGAAGWWRMRAGPDFARADARAARATWESMNRATRIVCAAALSLIALRMLSLGAEVLLRPVFPWEAVSAVAAKARVWYELGALAPFVPPASWLEGLGNYTDTEPGAFALPSLLLVWTAHAIGQWHEGAIGIPWWMLGLSMVLALYGHLRRAGGGVAFALCVAYLFLSLPLVDVHIALAGAPQWIAAAGIGLAGCALLRWLDAPSRELVYCFAIGAALAVLSMASTWPWYAIFAVAITIRHRPRFAAKLAVGFPFLVLFALLALLQTPISLAGMVLKLQVATGWGETLESLFLLDNWHLLYGVALLVAIIGWRFVTSPPWLARTWIMIMGLGLMFVWGALSVPGIWYGGLRDFSYAALQFAPLLVFWTATAARAAAFRDQQQVVPTTPEVPA
jgi:hypothetical protein